MQLAITLTKTGTTIILLSILVLFCAFIIWNAWIIRQEEKRLNKRWNDLHFRNKIDSPNVDKLLDITEDFYHN